MSVDGKIKKIAVVLSGGGALIRQGEKEAEETLSRHYRKEIGDPCGRKKMVVLSR